MGQCFWKWTETGTRDRLLGVNTTSSQGTTVLLSQETESTDVRGKTRGTCSKGKAERAALPQHRSVEARSLQVKTSFHHQEHSLPMPHLYSLNETTSPLCTWNCVKQWMSNTEGSECSFQLCYWFTGLFKFSSFYFPYLQWVANHIHTFWASWKGIDLLCFCQMFQGNT